MDIGVAFSAFKNILSHKKFAGVIKPVTTQTFVKVSLQYLTMSTYQEAFLIMFCFIYSLFCVGLFGF